MLLLGFKIKDADVLLVQWNLWQWILNVKITNALP